MDDRTSRGGENKFFVVVVVLENAMVEIEADDLLKRPTRSNTMLLLLCVVVFC